MKSWVFAILAAITFSAAAAEPAAGKQVERKLKAGDESMPYLLYLPEKYEEKEKWPVILFLHGLVEIAGPLSIVAK